ncbi:MAG: SCO family protein [Bacteroidetes bacterium]|nr:MAG: SCO family protein [Bacteroidota bacterium]
MRFLAFFIIAVSAITVGYFMIKDTQEKPKLKVINPVDVEQEMVDSLLHNKGRGHTIGAFRFQNQYVEWVTDEDVQGDVFVAEYFFTTCGTICPKMNAQMKRVQEAYQQNEEVKILSFTVDPEVDTVEQMLRYANAHSAQKGRWHFLTGDKTELYQLARTSFFVLKPAEAANAGDANSDFIHTNNFVLVDRKMRIRGYYDGTSPSEVKRLIEHIQVLLDEREE